MGCLISFVFLRFRTVLKNKFITTEFLFFIRIYCKKFVLQKIKYNLDSVSESALINHF
jgi:hypothetical protein